MLITYSMKLGDWIPTSRGSWGNEVNIPISDDLWPNTYKLPFAIGYDSWAKMFQFKILHRILPKNKKLVQWGIKDCKKCDYCDMGDESMVHLFCKCNVAGGIWEEVVNWFNSFGYNKRYLTDQQILFVDASTDPIFNMIILITKFAIFKNKNICKPVSLGQIISILREQFEVEILQAETTGIYKYFRGFWSPIRTVVSRQR